MMEAGLSAEMRKDLGTVNFKNIHNLKAENYVLFSRNF